MSHWAWGALSTAIALVLAQCNSSDNGDSGAFTTGEGGAAPNGPPVAGAAGSEAGAAGAPASGDCAGVSRLRLEKQGASWGVSAVGNVAGQDDGQRPRSGACAEAGAGPDLYYTLDASMLQDTALLTAVVEAPFEAVLSLERGPCADPAVLACDHGATEARPNARLELEVEPGVYTLHVSGAREADQGAFHLGVGLMPRDTDCEFAPPEARCQPLRVLDANAPVQTVVADARCASAQPGDTASLYYLLDLRGEPEATGVHVLVSNEDPALMEVMPDIQIYSDDAAHELEEVYSDAITECGYVVAQTIRYVASSSHASAVLDPGLYRVRVFADEPWYGTVRFQIARGEFCDGPQHDTCADAETLDLSAGFVEVAGSTLCNHNDQDLLACVSSLGGADRFYRIDLSDRQGPTTLRARITNSDLDFSGVLTLFMDDAGDCGMPLMCRDSESGFLGPSHFEAVVEPGVYLISVDGVEPGAMGRFRMQVHAADYVPEEFPVPCYGEAVDDCAYPNELFGITNDLTSPLCSVTALACGLDPTVQACVCEGNPACCTGEAGVQECAQIFCDCAYFCPDYTDAPISCDGELP